jgi:L,D-transpeptidase YcbB
MKSFAPFFKGYAYLFPVLVLFVGCGLANGKKEFSDKFRKQVEALNDPDQSSDNIPIHNPEAIATLYEEEGELVLPKWGNREKVDEMLFVIRTIGQEGLRPEDYHLEAIEMLIPEVFDSENPETDDMVRLELLLTDAYLLISTHLSGGKVDAETIDPRWKAARRTARHDLAQFVDSTIVHDNIIESLQSLTPSHREYITLKKGLASYRELAATGGWEAFELTVPKLEKGMTHPDVAKLRKRLVATQGDVYGDLANENSFDEVLHDQVVLFQSLNGLDADGVVGKGSLAALNISVEERIAGIEANLERWRWLSDDLGERYIKVNIANFELQVVENDQPVFISRAIVGRPYRETPVFSSRMNHLVFAPTWTVPPTILWQDVIPAVRKNPAYLAQKNMQVLRRDGSVVDPSSIDWKNVNRSNFPYMVRQAPGKDNALGDVKFMFPNQYSVYIHDTPTRNLFVHADRSFSSGCIRISKPLELAEYLLKDKKEWTPEQIKRVIAQGRERTVFITEPISVHILYLTAWADAEGTVHFGKDIYNRDKPLLNALKTGGQIPLPSLKSSIR